MLEGLYSALESYKPPPANAQPQTQPRKVLRMVKNERMGGSVPVWETAKPPETAIEKSLSQALNTNHAKTPDAALAYNANAGADIAAAQKAEEFGFGDLIDMVNPLHHIPVVGHFYREISGDQIKPIGNIIGGALFGGPLGVASGLINAVIIEETGKDLGNTAVAMAFSGEMPTFRQRAAQDGIKNDPQSRLARAEDYDLPGSLLAFADLKTRSDIIIERKS